MASDVKVIINLANPTTSAGFGYPLILQGKATTAIPYTVCTSLGDVATAVGSGFATNPIYQAAALMLQQNNAPSQFAIMAATGTTVATLPSILYQGWRQLIVVSLATEGESTAAQISDFIENNGADTSGTVTSTGTKMYFTSVTQASALTISGNERTVVMCHNDVNSVPFPEAALVGATAGKPAGSINYKNQQLVGITPNILTAAELTAIETGHALAFVQKAGLGVTSDGKTTSDEYIDIVDAKDYIVQNIEYETQLVLINNDKIPYDNNGISMLENVCVNVLQQAANNGLIATTEEGSYRYSVDYKGRSETAQSDRAARRYILGSFSFALAGAIDTVEINGTIEI